MKNWKSLIGANAIANATDEQIENFALLIRHVYQDAGYTFENLNGDIMWDYDITKEDCFDKLKILRDKLRREKNSPFKWLATCKKNGAINDVKCK
jgi:hypothetical protein